MVILNPAESTMPWVFTNESCWGKVVSAGFLDMRKAFDSLDHTLMLQCLHQLGTEIQWFSSCLSNRIYQVKYNHSYFGWGPIIGGIPQKSTLGPSYFRFMSMLCYYSHRMAFCSLLMTLVWSAIMMIIHRLRTFWAVI